MPGGTFFRRPKGKSPVKKRLKINGIIMGAAALPIIFFPRVFLRGTSGSAAQDMLVTFGFAFIILGQVIRVSARGYKAEHSRDSQALIQGGPYQVVRNPMYLGILSIGLGVVLMVFKWWAALIFIAVFTLRYILLIYSEEKKLSAMFPQEYPQYCSKVPRIFPSLSRLIKLDVSQYLPVKISWFYKEIGSMLTLLFLVLAVEAGEEIIQGSLRAYLRQSGWLFLTFIICVTLIFLLNKRTAKKYASSAN